MVLVPLEVSSDPVPRWMKAIQAIFAGHLATTQSQDTEPTIQSFSQTPQWELVQPTLVSILSNCGTTTTTITNTHSSPFSPSYSSTKQTLLDVMNDVLQSPSNIWSHPSKKQPREWLLTSKGKKTFKAQSS